MIKSANCDSDSHQSIGVKIAAAGDVNGDGKIGIAEADSILQKVGGIH